MTENPQIQDGKQLKQMQKRILNRKTKQHIDYLIENTYNHPNMIYQLYNQIIESQDLQVKLKALKTLEELSKLQAREQQSKQDIVTVLHDILGKIQYIKFDIKHSKDKNKNIITLFRYNDIIYADLDNARLLMLDNDIFTPLRKRVIDFKTKILDKKSIKEKPKFVLLTDYDDLTNGIEDLIKYIKKI